MNQIPDEHRTYSQWTARLTCCLIALPMLVYGSYIVLFSADGPFGEEHDLLRFFAAWYDADSWTDKYEALTIRATDHKPVTSYLTALLIYKLIGYVDFVYLGYVANLGVVGILWLTLVQFKRSNYFISLAFIASYLGFQLIPLGNMFWGGGGLAGNLAILFSLLSLVYLCKQTGTATAIAIIFALLAIYSLGNGLIVLPAALILLFCANKENVADEKDNKKRQYLSLRRPYLYRQLLVYELAGTGISLLFFSQNPPHLTASLAVTDFDVLTFISITLRLLGGGLSYDNVMLQTVFGIVIVAMCIGLIKYGYHKRQPALAAYMAFLVATIVVLCLYRNWTLLDPHANITRYYFISMQISIVLTLCYADMYLSRLYTFGGVVKIVSACLLVASWVFSYWFKTEEVATLCWNKKFYSQSQVIKVSKENDALETIYDEILKQAIERGYFDSTRLFSEKPSRLLSEKMSCYTGLSKSSER